jgi:hypothetical protein
MRLPLSIIVALFAFIKSHQMRKPQSASRTISIVMALFAFIKLYQQSASRIATIRTPRIISYFDFFKDFTKYKTKPLRSIPLIQMVS